MKLFYFSCFAVFLLVSCAKTSEPLSPPVAPTPPPVTPVTPVVPVAKNSFPYLVNTYRGEFDEIMRFEFNTANQLVSINILNFDTSTAPRTFLFYDTAQITFSYKDANSPASSYTFSWYDGNVYPATQGTENHILLYDSQGRMIKDSMSSDIDSSNPNPLLLNTIFSYQPGYILMKEGNQNIYYPDGIFQNGLDTITLQNGNITSNNNYYVFSTSVTLYESDHSDFLTQKNPIYRSDIANSLGPLLQSYYFHMIEYIGDFISVNLPTHSTSFMPPSKSGDITFTIISDSSSRVVETIGKDPSGVVKIQSFYQYKD